jgi:hypothetical protein
MADRHTLEAFEKALQHARAIRTDESSVIILLAQGTKVWRDGSYSGRVDELRAIRTAAQKVVHDIEQTFMETGVKLEEEG